MADPYVGEIRMFGGNFAPVGWAFCQGQLMAISENETLFNLIGTTYGGDGQSTFGLPNLQGRLPVHMGTLAGGSSYVIGQLAGVETVTITTNQLPAHNHTPIASSDASGSSDPTGAFCASNASVKQYVPQASGTSGAMGGASTPTGGSQPHDNMMPYLCVSFIISLFGIFPSQS